MEIDRDTMMLLAIAFIVIILLLWFVCSEGFESTEDKKVEKQDKKEEKEDKKEEINNRPRGG